MTYKFRDQSNDDDGQLVSKMEAHRDGLDLIIVVTPKGGSPVGHRVDTLDVRRLCDFVTEVLIDLNDPMLEGR